LEIEVIQEAPQEQRFVFHFIYSETYKIPIIYFNVYDTKENIPKKWCVFVFLKIYDFNSEDILAQSISNKFLNDSINSLPFIVQEVIPWFYNSVLMVFFLVPPNFRIPSIHIA